MRIVAISDTHGMHECVNLPMDADVLVVAGDFMNSGVYLSEITKFSEWLREIPFYKKIIVPGNHDILLQNNPLATFSMIENENTHILVDEELEIDGVRFYGTPWTPTFGQWAYMLDRGEKIREKIDKIPEGVDVVINHGVPYGINDENPYYEHVGCRDLRDRVNLVKPKVCIGGHIHGGHGHIRRNKIDFYNVAICNENYNPINKPTIINI